MKNQEFLSKKVMYSGFGNALDEQINANLEKGLEKFQITHQASFGKSEIEAVLSFNKSKESDLYFFNQYQLKIQPENGADEMRQTFFIGKENNITLKEAYNMMNGRAVFKEWNKLENVGDEQRPRFVATEEKYKAWVQLDFKEADTYGNYKQVKFHENYGFNLEAEVSKISLQELGNPDYKKQLLESLQKGNLQSATLISEEGESKVFLQAKPQFKRIGVYDEHMKEIEVTMGQKAGQSQSQKNNQKVGSNGQTEQKNNKNKANKISM